MLAPTTTVRPLKLTGTTWTRCWLVAGVWLATAAVGAAAVGEPRYVGFTPAPRSFAVFESHDATPLVVDANDWPGVRRAAADLQADVERVSGIRPALAGAATPGARGASRTAVLVGTVGHSPLIDGLVRSGKLDVTEIRGKWESWVTAVVAKPLPGLDRALVIAGSDKRGTIYGIYDLSEQLGVSPWYWWADVTPDHHEAAYVTQNRIVHGPPAVRYRGIFLNDEAPDLTNWIRAKFGNAPVRQDPPMPAGVANYGRAFYRRIFEVLLRLRANYLWPAMWSNAFNEDDPENARLADEYGIVMGTSHQEPMLRAQQEWDRRYHATLGSWNYAKTPEVLEAFWRDGIRRNRDFESLITIGLRGANDTEMAPGGPAANRALLEQIVERQRQILREEMPGREVPQVWCLYKEVQDYYDAGMRVPDDVTLLWAEDNWGNVRRLPTAAERKRAGGAGVYYHFDYHGGPRSYQWLNTNPLPKIWDQLSLAYQHGADRIWIVNVGHFKGYEVPTEFFINLAWQPARWNAANTGEFLQGWATREFGPAHAQATAEIVARYTKYNGRRKPELLRPDTYSLVNGHEAERVVAEFEAAAVAANEVYHALPPAKRDAFYELVLFPTLASARVNEVYLAAGRNQLYAAQGRASANEYAQQTRKLFDEYLGMVGYFHHNLAGGRWDHFMDEPVFGYVAWNDPPHNRLDHIRLAEVAPSAEAALGVAVEGTTAAWPSAAGAPQLPAFDALNQQERTLEVFNRGTQPFQATLTPSAPWLVVTPQTAVVGPDQRITVSVNWRLAPVGESSATIDVAGAGSTVRVGVTAIRPADVTRQTVHGFAEDAGCVSIAPEHATANLPGTTGRWTRFNDYGRTGSAMRAEAAADTEPAEPGRGAAVLEYRFHLYRPATPKIILTTSPTLAFLPGRPLRYAIAIDDAPPQVVTLVPAGYSAQNGNKDWERVVADNARRSTTQHAGIGAGAHTLRIWMIDPAVVVQHITVDLGGLQPSYLGPPESFHRP